MGCHDHIDPIFYELPERFKLDIQYRPQEKTKSYIEFIGHEHQSHRFLIQSKDPKYSKIVNLPSQSIYTVNLITENPQENGYFNWESIKISIPLDNTQQSENNSVSRNIEKPNILVYVIDALRADHMGVYGYERKTTHNIDRFASQNATFLNSYAHSSWTRPSAATILSGLLPKNHKTMTRENKFPDSVNTLSEVLKENGYYTVAIITNGNLSEKFGFNQGFDQFIQLKENIKTRSVHARSDIINSNIFGFFDDYNKSKNKRPFFLFVWSTDPHDPYTPPNITKDFFNINQFEPINTDLEHTRKINSRKITLSPSQIKYMMARYDQEVCFNDIQFGKLVEEMRVRGLYDNSMIILTSDHGEEFYDHSGFFHGNTLYDEMVRVPIIIKSSYIEKGLHYEIATLSDIYPTILDILAINPKYHLDGVSLLSQANYEKAQRYFEQKLGGGELYAILHKGRKTIMRVKPFLRIEAYSTSDQKEMNNLYGLSNYNSIREIESLINFVNLSGNNININYTTAEITFEIDNTLRQLGYAK